MQYRRSTVAGGTYFFMVNLTDRSSDLLLQNVDILRQVVRDVRSRHPFDIVAMVVLPEHIHAIWQLPEGDRDYSQRWSLIKSAFSRAIPKTERISIARQNKRERGVWQRRYWEHQIRDEMDLARHVDYIHIKPVKHGHVSRVIDWRYSTFHRYVTSGLLVSDWAGEINAIGAYGERA